MTQESPPTASAGQLQWKIEPYARHLDRGSSEVGDIGTTRVGTELSAEFSPFANWSVAVSGGVERSHYSLPSSLRNAPAVESSGLADFDGFQLGIQAAYQSSEQWVHMLYGNVSIGQEPGASLSDSLRSALYVGSQYSPIEELALKAGLVAFTQLEGRTVVSPLLGLEASLAEAWHLTVGLPETSLTYAVTESLRVGAKLDFEFFDYRLDEQGPLAGAALTNELVTLGLRTEWDWSESGSAWLFLGTPIHNRLKVRDQAGVTHLDASVDPALSIGFGLELRL